MADRCLNNTEYVFFFRNILPEIVRMVRVAESYGWNLNVPKIYDAWSTIGSFPDFVSTNTLIRSSKSVALPSSNQFHERVKKKATLALLQMSSRMEKLLKRNVVILSGRTWVGIFVSFCATNLISRSFIADCPSELPSTLSERSWKYLEGLKCPHEAWYHQFFNSLEQQMLSKFSNKNSII